MCKNCGFFKTKHIFPVYSFLHHTFTHKSYFTLHIHKAHLSIFWCFQDSILFLIVPSKSTQTEFSFAEAVICTKDLKEIFKGQLQNKSQNPFQNSDRPSPDSWSPPQLGGGRKFIVSRGGVRGWKKYGNRGGARIRNFLKIGRGHWNSQNVDH